MKAEIAAWKANGKPYRLGVSLYVRYGRNDLVKKMLSSEGETPFKKKKLIEELDKLDLPEEKVQEAQQAEVKQVQEQNTSSFYLRWPKESCTDETEYTLWLQASRLLKEIADLHSQLTFLPNDLERSLAAFFLLKKDDELDMVYERRDYYKKHGMLPETQKIELVTEPLAMAKRITALQRYIRREKQNLLKKPEDTGAAERLKRFTEELKHYTNETTS